MYVCQRVLQLHFVTIVACCCCTPYRLALLLSLTFAPCVLTFAPCILTFALSALSDYKLLIFVKLSRSVSGETLESERFCRNAVDSVS